MSHLVPASICEMEIFSQHLWDGEEDFFSESDLASQPTPTHFSWRVLIFLLSLFKLFIAYLSLPSSKSWVVNPYGLFPIFFQIFSPYHFFISIQMFSLRKYFPHFISPSQSKYFFPSYFPYLSSPSQSNNYFPSPIISLFFFTVLLPPNYPFSSFLFL